MFTNKSDDHDECDKNSKYHEVRNLHNLMTFKMVTSKKFFVYCVGEYEKLKGIIGQPPEGSMRKRFWRICLKTFKEI